MKVNNITRHAFRIARQKRELIAKGYERVGADHPGKLWELDRGWRHDREIVDAIIGADGKSIFVKIEPRGLAKRALLPPMIESGCVKLVTDRRAYD